jgi:hypothetical protein
MWLYKFIDAPELPPELEAKVMTLYNDPNRESQRINSNDYANDMKPDLAGRLHPKDVVAIKDGKSYRNSRGFRYTLDQQVSDWIHKHLSDQYTDCGLSVIHGPDGLLAPHTDQTRRFAVLYTFDTGGADVRTAFYQEHGYPVERELREFGTDYDRLKEVHAVQFPLRTWVIMNTNVLHSVENLVSDRIQIQFGLNEVPDDWTYQEEIKL